MYPSRSCRSEGLRWPHHSDSEVQVDTKVNRPHTADRRRLAEERRRHRAAVAKVVAFIGQVLSLHEHLKAVAGGALIERPDLCRSTAAKHADAGWQRRRSSEGKHIPDHHVQPRLTGRTKRIAPDAGRTIVENAVAVVVATGDKRVGWCAVGIEVHAHEQIAHDLVVERDIQAVADVGCRYRWRGPTLERSEKEPSARGRPPLVGS